MGQDRRPSVFQNKQLKLVMLLQKEIQRVKNIQSLKQKKLQPEFLTSLLGKGSWL
jgi:hypothetical protein